MRYSYNWLQKHIVEKLPTPDVLKETIIFHAFEVESVEDRNGDSIFDIKVLPDRAGDCLSHFGMAREIAGLLKLKLKDEVVAPLPTVELALPVEIKSDFCRRYIAVQFDNVKVGPSPTWLKDVLESVGQRSINNIVDATNYILLDTGQPTHAFDAQKIDGGITVRLAHAGESIVTLSEEQKTLKENMLVIADYVGALAIAGVKGGKTAEVEVSTTSIILEIANFDPISVRKTSRSLGLITDASKRFENNFSPELARGAAEQLVALVLEVAGGAVVGVNDIYPTPTVAPTLTFTHADIARVLGSTVTTTMIEDVLSAYMYDYTKKEDTFTLTVPAWRADITGTHDVAEEIGRVIGYDTIPAHPLPFTPVLEEHGVYTSIRAVKKYLVEKGYSEVMTYTFRPKGEIYVAYGAKDKSALRTTLSDGLKESYERNRLSAPLLGLYPAAGGVRLFEVGTVFTSVNTKTIEAIHVATVDNGTFQELALEDFVKEHSIVFDRVGSTFNFQLSTFNLFHPWSLYPFIVRDIAVWIPEEDTALRSQVEKVIADFGATHTVRAPYCFDTFTKEGKTSYAYRCIFQSYEKTLTDGEVQTLFEQLQSELSAIPGVEIR